MTRVAAGSQSSLQPGLVRFTLLHAFAWLLLANLIGDGLALLLLFPHAGHFLGPLTYGRWMPVHMNAELYGWVALPLVAWLFPLYRLQSATAATLARAAVWLWTIALAAGALDWLHGRVTGKLFLDWSGYPRMLFPVALGMLWLALAVAYGQGRSSVPRRHRLLAGSGLLLLAAVPFLLYRATDPAIYPAVNPSTGGPTGASQLESSLAVVLILFVLPLSLVRRQPLRGRVRVVVALNVGYFLLELAVLAMLPRMSGGADASHHLPVEYLAVLSLLPWAILTPTYLECFCWPAAARRWLWATEAWWALLVVAGCISFLPGVLDRIKFTDALVAHSILAMAGFVTSLLLVVAIVLLGETGARLDGRWSFWTWNMATLLYVVLFSAAGWVEGADPAFTMVPGAMRNGLYLLRLLQGLAMTAAGADWLVQLTGAQSCRQAESAAATLSSQTVRIEPPTHSQRNDKGEETSMKKRLLLGYQLVAGGSDAATGAALLVAPRLTLGWMGLTVAPEPIVFLQYIGVFVLAVGLSYWLVAFSSQPMAATRWRTQWEITALVRTLVAAFVLVELARHALEPRWISVVLTDGLYAGLQWTGLRLGWLMPQAIPEARLHG